MKLVVADTHSALWYLENDKRLTPKAAVTLDAAERILLPGICLVEIVYLAEKARINDAALPRLLSHLNDPATTLQVAALDLGVVRSLQEISRHDVPDMPDRIIAATAFFYGVPLVTIDCKIRSCGIETIW
jgi:PIN domain nuclease of toxin-antitoxin system